MEAHRKVLDLIGVKLEDIVLELLKEKKGSRMYFYEIYGNLVARGLLDSCVLDGVRLLNVILTRFEMEKKVVSHLSTKGRSFWIPRVDWNVGDEVQALYEEEYRYYDAKVRSVQGDKAEVVWDDDGTVALVDMRKIRGR